MKKLFVLLLMLVAMNASGQWQPDVRLTNDLANSVTSYNNARSVAASGTVVHVVWYDIRDGNMEIYYKRSTDVGVSWGADTRLTSNSSISRNPSVSESGAVVHVLWEDNRDGNFEIYYKCSTDGGASWGTDTRLTSNSANSWNPSVSVTGSVVDVVWEDNRDGNYEIYYKNSTDGGVSWETDKRLTSNSAVSEYPCISVSSMAVHVAWYDMRDGNYEVFYKRSTDGGVSWGIDIRLTNNSAISMFHSISVSGSVVLVVWQDKRDGNYEIYYKRSTDEGSSWGLDIQLTDNSALSVLPSVSISGSNVHVVWRDQRDGNDEIYYNRSTDGGVSWGTDIRLTNCNSVLNYPSVAVWGSAVHVVWHDNRDGNYEIYYKGNPTGNIVGIQWQQDVRLTNDPGNSVTSLNNARSVAASGNVVHVAWTDNRDGNEEIYYKRSVDGGSNWETDTRLTSNSANSGDPSVSVNDSVVHVVWNDNRDGNSEIYYKSSTDGGTSWGTDTRLTSNAANSQYPSVSVSGSIVHVVWQDDREGGDGEIYYKRSTDGGSSWDADIRLTSDVAVSEYPSVSVSGPVVHVAWEDRRDGNYEIYYKRSSDGGVSWGTDTRLTDNSAFSYLSSVSVSGQSVYIVWQDDRDGNYEIYVKRSTDGGSTWGTDTRLTNDPADSYIPSVSASGANVHVVWRDQRDGNDEIYYNHSTDGGSTWGTDTRLTNNTAFSYRPAVSASGLTVHVVWEDLRDGNPEIYYKCYPAGNVTGIENIDRNFPKEFSLAQNYPNPFNPSTKISWQSPVSGWHTLKVYDLLGREVATLVDEYKPAGSYEVEFQYSVGSLQLASGVYFYQLKVGDPSSGSGQSFIQTKKMILIK